jgi:putative membrane protein insertion efficiency factor
MSADAFAGAPPQPSVVARLLLAAIRGYQLALSPLFAGACRHMPSCSEYAREAIARFGAWRGSYLGLRRLMRCHPLGTRGYDPVPDATGSEYRPGKWRH